MIDYFLIDDYHWRYLSSYPQVFNLVEVGEVDGETNTD